jgi:hypothetical protein
MNSTALARAAELHKTYDMFNKKAKRSALKELAAFGFTVQDIHTITKLSVPHISGVLVVTPGKSTPWNVKTLDALYILSTQVVPKPALLQLIVKAGTPLRSIARLTGHDIEDLRDATRDVQ